MLLRLIYFLADQLTNLLTHMVRSVLWFSLFFSFAYSFGWVQRLICLMLEQTATSLWNGTPVTIGSLEVDLIRGRVWATNVIIHTNKRDEWQWESPLICRIGRVYVEHNWFSSFFAMLFRMACGQGQKHILELYTVEMSDIQGFIERKQHIFNFYLMDPFLELPDPKKILEEEKEARMRQPKAAANANEHHSTNNNNDTSNISNDNDNTSEASLDLNTDAGGSEAAFPNSKNNFNMLSGTNREEKDNLSEGEEEDAMVHRQAQQLVDDMFSAVKSIGRAARQRGSLAGALIEQRAQLTSKLKQFKGTKNKSEAMQEGVKVIRRVGKAVAKKTKDMKNVMPKMPPRRQPDIAPVYARVGRVIIEDARIFTRTNTSTSSSSQGVSTGANTTTTTTEETNTVSENTKNTSEDQSTGGGLHKRDNSSKGTAMSNHGLGAKWNKPLVVSDFVLRSSELCPPNSLLDENGLPAIYQPLDKIVDVVMKRALVGLAKSNTTRFLQTALGEILELEYSTIFGDHDIPSGNINGNPLPSKAPASNPPLYRRSSSAALSEPIM